MNISWRLPTSGHFLLFLGRASSEVSARKLDISNRAALGEGEQVLDAAISNTEHEAFSCGSGGLGDGESVYCSGQSVSNHTEGCIA